jgi:hypothetical protein
MKTTAAHFAAAPWAKTMSRPRRPRRRERSGVDPAAPRGLQLDLRTDGAGFEQRELGHVGALGGCVSGHGTEPTRSLMPSSAHIRVRWGRGLRGSVGT